MLMSLQGKDTYVSYSGIINVLLHDIYIYIYRERERERKRDLL